ncbi:hypothetical protein ACQKJG_18275 [Priestia megaterium]|uniref:hypothetical protein n=1 Tax=Priestia megaterium TaxID=1404 RepID=UPI003CFE5C06
MTMPNVMQFPNTAKTLVIMSNFINAVAMTDVGKQPYEIAPTNGKHKGVYVSLHKGSRPFFISMKEYMDPFTTDDDLWKRISQLFKKEMDKYENLSVQNS